MKSKNRNTVSTKKTLTLNVMRTLFNILILLIAASHQMLAQNPIPADESNLSVLLTNATIFAEDQVYENGVLGIRDGKIEFVGDAATARVDPNKFDTILNFEGKNIYPGLIAMNTTLGLTEIAAVRATKDHHETGDFNASSRSVIAYNTDSRVTPTIRTNGVLLAQVIPQGGRVSGTSSVMELDGWNWEDAVYAMDEGIHINWPSQVIKVTDDEQKQAKQEQKNANDLKELRKFFTDAKAYASISDPSQTNIQFESLKSCFEGEKNVYVHCDHMKDILLAIDFSKEMKISMVLVGGQDSWRVTNELKSADIPVVIINSHRLPMREDSEIYLPYKLPKILSDAGVEFAIGTKGFWQVRNLPFQAGTSAAFGLPKEEALKAISLYPARIMKIDEKVGSIKEGKDATIIVTDGDILDMKSSVVNFAMIRGKFIHLESIQTLLYRKYMDKYNLSY